jgi:hypothetical protein
MDARVQTRSKELQQIEWLLCAPCVLYQEADLLLDAQR